MGPRGRGIGIHGAVLGENQSDRGFLSVSRRIHCLAIAQVRASVQLIPPCNQPACLPDLLAGASLGRDQRVLGRIMRMRRFRPCAIAKPRRHKSRGTVLRVPEGTAGPRGRESCPGPSMASASHSSLCISAASRSRSDMPGTISLLSFANRRADPPQSTSPRPIAGSSRSPQRAAGCDPRLPARTGNHHENHSQDRSQLLGAQAEMA
jgi:hypothetical protein